MVVLIAVVIGVLFVAVIALLLLPERRGVRSWYTEPDTLFGTVVLLMIVVALSIPHG